MKKTLFTILILIIVVPFSAFAATEHKLHFTGWIPFWHKELGVSDVIAHFSQLDSVSPFGYHVDADGTLLDTARMDEGPWGEFTDENEQSLTKIIPTILWGDAVPMQRILGNAKKRNKHIAQIVTQILDDPRFAGVDIDYEAKQARSQLYYSAFLRTLHSKAAARQKLLVCTIEARTPVHARYTTVNQKLLDSIQYSNDYAVIGEHCDIVRIMAYDQGAIDVKLNAQRDDMNYYAPVADIAWVEKVLKLAMEKIPAKKIELGVASYGYVWELTPATAPKTGYSYKRIRATNYPQAKKLCEQNSTMLSRNSAGEVSCSFPSKPMIAETTTNKITLVWVSDSTSVEQKVELARKLRLRGIAVFKFDGEHDGKLWDVLK